MWLLTTRGFFSIVSAGERDGQPMVCVRARDHADLESVQQLLDSIGYTAMLQEDKMGKRDYRFRMVVPTVEWCRALECMGEEITYTNFKDAVKRVQGEDRADLYAEVWQTLYLLQV